MNIPEILNRNINANPTENYEIMNLGKLTGIGV